MKAFFTHPITITVGIIITLGILAIVGYNYWGWFGGKSNGMTGWPPPDFDCDSTIKQGGFTYKLQKVFPSKNNDGTYKAMFVVTEIVPQHIQNTIERGLSKSQYNKLVAKCPELIPATPTDNYQQDEATNRSQENETSRKASTIPVNKNWNYTKVDVWQKDQQGDTIKLSGSAIPSMFQKGVLVAVNMQSANGNQTIALNQHILDINNSQGWMIVSLYNSTKAPQWVGGYVQKV